jgi:hypothetical protein
MACNKKLKLILPAQLPGTIKKQSNILAALDTLKDELDLSPREIVNDATNFCGRNVRIMGTSRPH